LNDWWQQPYAGGPMVPVAGFPRELYPPVDGKPMPGGLDVVGYKRTVWRAGRWQGPASRFDELYSTLFAFGCGPNVIDTGVAGVQRQQNQPDDGVIDEQLFNTLRSMRVPEGKPHAGEMCMDATAQNLISQAYADLQPKPAPKATTRERALDGAISWIGYKESPASSNHTTFGSWYGMDYQPWCAMAATYWFVVEAGGSPSFARGSRYSFCPYIVSDAGAQRNGLNITSKPIPGDLVVYDFERDGTFDHVGIFEDGNAQSWTAIEGNTSAEGSAGSQSNGGQVARRNRTPSSATVVFVRVDEP
jgi:CHAP domain